MSSISNPNWSLHLTLRRKVPSTSIATASSASAAAKASFFGATTRATLEETITNIKIVKEQGIY